MATKKTDGPTAKGGTRTTRKKNYPKPAEVLGEEVSHEDVPLEGMVPAEVIEALKSHTAALKLVRTGARTTYKVNLGNFESFEMSAWIDMPSTPAKVDQVFAAAQKWVNKKIEAAMEAAEELRNEED